MNMGDLCLVAALFRARQKTRRMCPIRARLGVALDYGRIVGARHMPTSDDVPEMRKGGAIDGLPVSQFKGRLSSRFASGVLLAARSLWSRVRA